MVSFVDMRRKIGVAFLLILIVSPVAYLGFLLALSTNLSWSVSVGEEFTFLIVEDGWELTGGGATGNMTYFTALNGTMVTVEIIDLPSLGFYLSGSDFIDSVVERTKVSISFENGSSIDATYPYLVRAISICILPVGSWMLIDYFFPDSDSLDRVFSVYYAYQTEDTFRFGYNSLDIDLILKTKGIISLDTGIPLSVSWYRRHGVDSEHNITLTQLYT